MGKLAQEALQYLNNSYDAKRNFGVVDGNGSSKDSKMNWIEDALTRVELELAGVNTKVLSTQDILGHSMDASPAYQIPDVTHYDGKLRFVEYANIDILRKMQVTSEIPVGAQEHKFLLDDYSGSYKRLTGMSSDLPTVSLSGKSYTVNIEMGGGAISWDQQEIDTATFSGRPLDVMQVRAIRRSYLENIYELVINGNEKLKGLIGSVTEFSVIDTVANPNSVTLGTVESKYWINKIGREIVNDWIQARIKIAILTQSRWGGPEAGGQPEAGNDGNPSGFTGFISQDGYYQMIDKYMTSDDGGDRPETVWSYLNSPKGKMQTGISEYVIVHKFGSAFQNGTKNGFMVLPNSPDAYSFEKPLDLTPKPVQFRDLKMIVPYYDYFAGMKLVRDDALVGYYDIAAPS